MECVTHCCAILFKNVIVGDRLTEISAQLLGLRRVLAVNVVVNTSVQLMDHVQRKLGNGAHKLLQRTTNKCVCVCVRGRETRREERAKEKKRTLIKKKGGTREAASAVGVTRGL